MAASWLLIAAIAAVAAQPSPGPLGTVSPLANLRLGLRHCNYVASACPLENGVQDFMFVSVAALNGQGAPAFSLQSVNYPTFYLAIVNQSSGAAGIVENPDVNDASWAADAPKAAPPPGTTDAWSPRSLR